MEKTLEQLLKNPNRIGVTDIAEFVCTGYEKDISQVIRLLDAYVESMHKEHKRELAAKDAKIKKLISEPRSIESKIRKLVIEVEQSGASVDLTKCSIALQQAQRHLSDHLKKI